MERICFQVEEAQWFYEDFVRPLDPNLPSLTLRQFCLKIFQHCPLFSGYDSALHSHAFSEFLAYKTRVPVRGAILLNDAMTEAVLVKGWKKGANWSFPRGKINKDEKDIDCAVREVYEETGYDVRAAGLVNEEDAKYIEITMREQHMKLFVFAGVPMDTRFEPRTRKEISKIQWYKLTDLPTSKKLKQQQQQQQEAPGGENLANKFYMVAPFLGPLKRIIAQLRRVNGALKNAQVAEPSDLQQALSGATQQQNGLDNNQTDTIGGLVAMLRQSRQITERQPQAERPSSVLSDDEVSARVRDMLNVSGALVDPVAATPITEDFAAARTNKAQAIMSLIRSGTGQPSTTDTRGPSVPRSKSSQKPASGSATSIPTHRPSPIPTSASRPDSGAKGIISDQSSSARVPDLPSANNILAEATSQYKHAAISAVGHKPLPPTAPYHLTGDFSLSQGTQPPQATIGTNAPAPRKLPVPKLNAHSSALLDLFKSSPSAGLPKLSSGPQTSAAHSATLLELFKDTSARPSAPSKQDSESPSTPLVLDQNQITYSANKDSGNRPRSTRTTHQETLLGLFKGGVSAKPSPSPASVLPPAELSATSGVDEDLPAGGFKSSESANPKVGAAAVAPGQIKIAKRPDAPASAHSPKGRLQQSKDAIRDAPKPVKILARPQSRDIVGSGDQQLITSSAQQPERASPRRKPAAVKQEPEMSTPIPFQPQILKRPTSSGEAPIPHATASIKTDARARKDARAAAPRKPAESKSANPPVSILPRPGNSAERAAPLAATDKAQPKMGKRLLPRKNTMRDASDYSEPLKQHASARTPSRDDDFLLKYLGQVAREGR